MANGPEFSQPPRRSPSPVPILIGCGVFLLFIFVFLVGAAIFLNWMLVTIRTNEQARPAEFREQPTAARPAPPVSVPRPAMTPNPPSLPATPPKPSMPRPLTPSNVPMSPPRVVPPNTPPFAPPNAKLVPPQLEAERADGRPRTPDSARTSPTTTIPETAVMQFGNMGWTVKSLAFSPDDSKLAVGKLDRTIKVFDAESGRLLGERDDLRSLGQVTAVAFSPDGSSVYAGGYTGAIEKFVLDGGSLRPAFTLQSSAREVTCLVAAPNGSLLISGDSSGQVGWQEPVEDGARRSLDLHKRATLAIHVFDPPTTALSTNGNELCWIDLNNSTINDRRIIRTGYGHAAAISSDGKRIAVSYGSEIALFDDKGQELWQAKSDDGVQWTMKFTPDGRQLITGGRGKASIWDAETGERTGAVTPMETRYIQTLAITSDSKRIATIPASSGQVLKIYELPVE